MNDKTTISKFQLFQMVPDQESARKQAINLQGVLKKAM
jgi:hypothetical protein